MDLNFINFTFNLSGIKTVLFKCVGKDVLWKSFVSKNAMSDGVVCGLIAVEHEMVDDEV